MADQVMISGCNDAHDGGVLNWTHSWTVHSGIVWGIWPLFSRLQSTSSPKHTQGGGHVLALAPDPRCALKTSRTTTANFAKLRSCVAEHIFSGHTREQPFCSLYLQPQAKNPKRDKSAGTIPGAEGCFSPRSLLISNPSLS